MNSLIENGYVIVDLKELVSDQIYNEVDKIANELSSAKTPYIEDYHFEYHLNKEDIKEYGLDGEDASVKIYDTSRYTIERRRKMGNDFKKKLIKKYFQIVQIFGLSNFNEQKLYESVKEINLSILDKFYSFVFDDPSQINEKTISNNSTKRLTVYDENCKIIKHKDGYKSDRVFALLLYLNKEWDENNGGQLVLFDKQNNEIKVSPKGLKVCILDFMQNNIEHEVLEVLSGVRYTYVMFVDLAENITKTDLWKKHKKGYA